MPIYILEFNKILIKITLLAKVYFYITTYKNKIKININY